MPDQPGPDQTQNHPDYAGAIQGYFGESFSEHGASPHGVHWNSDEAQQVRFRQLLRIVEPSVARGERFTLLDYGCGYGALLGFMDRQDYPPFAYTGYDLVAGMVTTARETYAGRAESAFTADEASLAPADYIVASGIFNVQFDPSRPRWTDYILKTLHRLDEVSVKGFAFNMLTRFSDPGKMRADLYYADPAFFFNYCRSLFALNVALLHDYGIYDFTILVRKD